MTATSSDEDDLLRRIAADLDGVIAMTLDAAASTRALVAARERVGLDATAARARLADAEARVARMRARRERVLAHLGLKDGSLAALLTG